MKNNFYICEKYFLLIYETKEIALTASAASTISYEKSPSAAVKTPNMAAYWSNLLTKDLNAKVIYSNANEPILLLKAEENFWNVIIGEKIGWIVVEDWMKIKQLERSNGT